LWRYPGSDRNLFALWLLGFAGYFVTVNMKIDRAASVICGALSVFLIMHWVKGRVPGSDYALIGYPLFAMSFVCLVIATQNSQVLASPRRLIETLAGCSYSLFLIHLVFVKPMIFWFPGPKWLVFALAVIVANVAAYYFARATEAKHKRLSSWILQNLKSRIDPVSHPFRDDPPIRLSPPIDYPHR
jgi:peptidoglycan/LPS O-acetylase OafA/YrhL